MRHLNRYVQLSLCAAAVLAAGCGAGANDRTENVGVQTNDLTTEQSVLGLESAAQWATSSGSLSTSTTHSQGTNSVAISTGVSYVEVSSSPTPLSTLSSVDSTLSFDVRLPSSPAWGYAALSLNAPSLNLYNFYVGQVSLVGAPAGSFKTVSFPITSDLIVKLRQSYGDLSFKLILNIPTTTGTTYLDNVRFSAPTTVAPTYVLGKRDLTTVVPNEVVNNRVFNPQGVIVDRNTRPNRVYVWDSGNMRILGYSALGTCTGGSTPGAACTNDPDCSGSGTCTISGTRAPNLVFGQPDGLTAACNGDSTQVKPASASTLCPLPYPRAISLAESPEPASMAVDQNHNLYVPDKWNHRVLKYNDPFATNNVVADFVWGQPDFTKRECNQGLNAPTADTLCLNPETTQVHITGDNGGTGVDVDSSGNVWVTDTGNNRVLRYPPNSKTANVVLGQSDFTSGAADIFGECAPGAPSTGQHLCSPKVVRYNALTNQVFVIDWRGGSSDFRVHIFNNPAAGTKGPAAVETLVGNAGGTLNTAVQHWVRPYGLEFVPGVGNAFWLNDSKENRLLYYTKQSGTWTATKVIGQRNLTDITWYQGNLNCNNGTQPDSQCFALHPGGSVGIDSAGNLYASDLQDMRILRFPGNIADAVIGPNTGAAVAANAVLFPKPADSFGLNLTSGRGLYATNNARLVEYPAGTTPARQLIVFDQLRALFWNDYTNKTTFSTADGVLYQTDLASQHDYGQGILIGLSTNASGSKIFIGNSGGIDVFQGPLTTGLQPFGHIPLDVNFRLGGSTGTMRITGLAYDEASDGLWVSDSYGHRVMRIDHPLSTNRVINLVLGQPNATSVKPNRGVDNEYDDNGPLPCPTETPDSFGNMRGLRLDRQGNLYVVDAGHEGWQCSNNRVLEFDAATLVPSGSQDFFCGALDSGCSTYRRAKRVYGPPDFTSKDPFEGGYADSPNTPIGVAFDPNNRMMMVVDGYGNPQLKRTFYYSNPVPTCGQSGCAVPATRVFPVAAAQATDVFFDSSSNMVLMDHTWTRLLYYRGTDMIPWMSSP